MNLRELVILLLGLAMVIVVTRGLIVALRARRNQIKLAIDKNIPSDIDLDSLELAELPNGGARVVKRDCSKTEADEQRDSVEAQTDAAAHTAVNDAAADSSAEYDKPYNEKPDKNDASAVEAPALSSASSASSAKPSTQSSTELSPNPTARPDIEAEPAIQAQDAPALDEPALQPSFQPSFQSTRQPLSDPLSEASAQSNNESASAAETTLDPAQELAGEELFEETDGPLDSSADSPAESTADSTSEPPRFNEDSMEPFFLSAGERIGAHDPVPPAKRGGPKKPKSAPQGGDSLLTSARRGLNALMPKKETSSANAVELAPQLPESQVSQGEYNAALDASDVVDPLLDDDSSATVRDDTQALFEGYDQETESGNEAVGQAEVREESSALAIEAPESLAAESRAVAAADLFPETFDDVVAQSRSKSEGSSKKEKAKSKMPRERSHAAASSIQALLADSPADSEQSQRGGQNVDSAANSAGAAGELAQPAPQELNEVLVINVMAKRGRWLTGDKLLPLLLSQGLKFGELKIFSKRVGDRQDGEIVFSLANSLKPGTFDLNAMDSFATVGVTLFLELPTPINNLSAFDQMLQTAREIVEALDAELRDDQRNMMTGQTIEHYRQRVRDFELRLLHARAAEG